MKITKLENNPIYREAYRGYVAASKDRTKAAARHFMLATTQGLDNPIQTKLILSTARVDAKKDRNKHSNIFRKVEAYINNAKSNVKLPFYKEYRTGSNALYNSLKTTYKKSLDKRFEILEKGSVAIKNQTSTDERLKLLNIKPTSL